MDASGNPKDIPGLEEAQIKDLLLSLGTAEKRSQSLVKFVQTTKNLTQLPELSITRFKVSELFEGLGSLFKPEFDSRRIEFRMILKDPTLSLNADIELVEQVMINLIRNSCEAFHETKYPILDLEGGITHQGNVYILVRDNGKGIPNEQLEQIFIPFFTTKQKGSGIGLSLSRQIMKQHRGHIKVESETNKGTTVLLQF